MPVISSVQSSSTSRTFLPLTEQFVLTLRGGESSTEQSKNLADDDVGTEIKGTRKEKNVLELSPQQVPDEKASVKQQDHDKDATENQSLHDEEKASSATADTRTTDLCGERVDIPSLDTFINYDEATDILSTMAPVLETTTTHLLDTSIPAKVEEEELSNLEGTFGQIDDLINELSSDREEASTEDPFQLLSETATDSVEDDYDILMDEDLTLEEAQEKSSSIRLEGKKLHDKGDYEAAARAFAQASLVLEPFVEESGGCEEDWSTCRLHEALCCLKAEDAVTAVDACTRVLDRPSTSGAVRARALYRRAKAYTVLQENDLALQDARSAAFLGDRRGVALYGQLMRESPGFLTSSSTSSMMDDFASSSALFESLLSKSGAGSSTNDPALSNDAFPTFNPLSLLSGMGAGGPSLGSGMDTAGLAKSVITSLSKRIEDESTQDTICKYLQKTSGSQIRQYAGMAGMELPESQATRIANFLRGVTPKTIRKTVKNGKRLLYGVRLVRKTSQVITKYRNILIWICLLAWARSAILRPIPVNKRIARLAAKQAAKPQ